MEAAKLDTTALLATANSVLEAGISEDQLISRLEEYAQSFDLWFKSNQEALNGAASTEEKSQFGQLGLLHVAIIDRALTLKNKASLDLKNLRKLGKGIMAYTDQLPKSVSIHGTRKG